MTKRLFIFSCIVLGLYFITLFLIFFRYLEVEGTATYKTEIFFSGLGIGAAVFIWVLWWKFFGKERQMRKAITKHPPMTEEQERFVTENTAPSSIPTPIPAPEEKLPVVEPLSEEEQRFIEEYNREMDQ